MFTNLKRFTISAILLIICIAAHAFENGQTVRLIRGGKSLMMENSSLEVGKNAVLWTETNTNSQRWILTDTGKGTFNLQNAYSGYYLGGVSAATSNSIIGSITKSNTTSRGAWEFVPVEGKENTYIIYLNTARRIAISSETDIVDGTQIKLLTASTAAPEKIEWIVEVADPMENVFTADKRDAMMDAFKKRHYKKQTSGYSIDNGGFWGDAEMFETILDAYETTGKLEYATMFENLYTNFISRTGSDWASTGQGWPRSNEYNDDIAWICIACVRGYLLTGTTKYLTTAKNNFNKMFKRADCYGNDLLQWKYGDTNTREGTNACINGPAAVCACYLAIATADMSYYDKAIKTYKANRSLLYEMNNGTFTGKVFDSGNAVKGTVGNQWASTYNEGTSLGAAIMLYNYTGEEMYKKDADAINNWSKKNLANSLGIVHVCQTVSGDLCGFKGILMRYMRMYAAELGHPENYEWLAKNAYHAWNNRNSSGITSSAWLSKAEENFKHKENNDTKTFEAFGNSTCLSAAFNAHIGVVENNDAYNRIDAENFFFIKGAGIAPTGNDDDATGMAEKMRNNNYIGFKNVDFGTKPASHIMLRGYLLRPTGRISIYADAPETKNGTLLCTIASTDGLVSKQWATVEKAINVPLIGKHDIYAVCTGTNNYDLINLNWLQFKSVNTIFSDLTNNGGTLTSSLTSSPEEMKNLTDDNLLSIFNGQIDENGEAWVQYQSPTPILLKGMVLNTGLTTNAIKSYRLAASNDGETWEPLLQQDEMSCDVTAQRFSSDITTEQRYTYFRLYMDVAKEGQNSISISEWQLLGHATPTNDITSDGGSITEGMEALIDHIGNTETNLASVVTYQSNGNYMLSSYSITSGNGNAPSSWILEGSNNGTSWTKIDEQNDVTYPYENSTSCFCISPASSFIYYRLKELSDESTLTQWQLFGNLDYGTFFADVTTIATITSSDNSSTSELTDEDGTTYSSVKGENLCWTIESPIAIKPLGYSLLCADDANYDPQDIQVNAIDEEGNVTTLSTRSLTFAARASRNTVTLSSTKTFKTFQIVINSTTSGENEARLAEIEFYGVGIEEASSETLLLPSTVEASAVGLSSTEVIGRINDQNRTTRYRADFTEPVSITYSYDNPVKINMYALSASKDDPTRDPSAWTIEGSNDGENWDVIDNRSGETFSQRYATQFYLLNTESEYKNIRLTINKLNGGTQIQLSELQYLFLQPTDPTAISAVSNDFADGSIHTCEETVIISTSSSTMVRIYDANGQIQKAERVSSGRSSIPLPQTHGLYIIMMQINGKNIVKKVIK